MSEQTRFVQDGMDRLEDAYRSIEESVQNLQKDLSEQRKKIERQVTSNRKSFEKEFDGRRKQFQDQTRKQVSELRKTTLYKRASAFQKDAAKQIEERIDSFLDAFNIASQRDLKKVDRKRAQINKKLNQYYARTSRGSI